MVALLLLILPVIEMSTTLERLPETFEVPLKLCPQSVRAVASLVAEEALPLMEMPHVPLAPLPVLFTV